MKQYYVSSTFTIPIGINPAIVIVHPHDGYCFEWLIVWAKSKDDATTEWTRFKAQTSLIQATYWDERRLLLKLPFYATFLGLIQAVALFRCGISLSEFPLQQVFDFKLISSLVK